MRIVMFSVGLTPLGMAIRNQHETVKFPFVEVRLCVGSEITFMLALFVNVAACKTGTQMLPVKHNATTTENAVCNGLVKSAAPTPDCPP